MEFIAISAATGAIVTDNLASLLYIIGFLAIATCGIWEDWRTHR